MDPQSTARRAYLETIVSGLEGVMRAAKKAEQSMITYLLDMAKQEAERELRRFRNYGLQIQEADFFDAEMNRLGAIHRRRLPGVR